MIAAAAAAPAKLLFNWFDVVLVLIVAFGFWRGRRHGMSKELIPLIQCLTLVIGAGFGYQPLGDELIRLGVIREVFGKSQTELTAAYVTAYLVITAAVVLVFSLFKRRAKAWLEGSTAFGDGEYYLGIVAGVLRYACLTVFALALLNAPVYTQAEVIQARNFNNRWFGGGLAGYSGDFFPSLNEVQTAVLKDSLCGPFLRNNLAMLLINTVPPGHEVRPLGKGTTEVILQPNR